MDSRTHAWKVARSLHPQLSKAAPLADRPRSIGCPSADGSLTALGKAQLVERLARFRLKLHAGAHPRPVEEGIPFLGFVVFAHKRRLKSRKAVHYRRRLKGLVREYQSGRLPLDNLSASIKAWGNHAGYANTVGLRKEIIGQLRLGPPTLRRVEKGPRRERSN